MLTTSQLANELKAQFDMLHVWRDSILTGAALPADEAQIPRATLIFERRFREKLPVQCGQRCLIRP
jgi:hypothetical protein